MSQTVRNYNELKAEVKRLTERRDKLENNIRLNVRELAEQLKPVNVIKNAFSSVAGDTDLKNQFVARGLEAALSFIISNLLFKKAGGTVKAITTIFGTTLLSQLFGDDMAKYFAKFKNIIKSFIHKQKDDAPPPAFNETDVYHSD